MSSIEGTPPVTDPDAVPVVLAREIAYDVALVDLAESVGIETALTASNSRGRSAPALEKALLDSGVVLPVAEPSAGGPVPAEPRTATERQVPVASLRDSWLDRSLRRAANVAACVRRSMPSLPRRFET